MDGLIVPCKDKISMKVLFLWSEFKHKDNNGRNIVHVYLYNFFNYVMGDNFINICSFECVACRKKEYKYSQGFVFKMSCHCDQQIHIIHIQTLGSYT